MSETVIVAIVTALSTALLGLVPVYIKARTDRQNTAQQAQDKLIRRLSQDIDDCEADKNRLQERLDSEIEKRRIAEFERNDVILENRQLKAKIERLEKGQTGPLKPQ